MIYASKKLKAAMINIDKCIAIRADNNLELAHVDMQRIVLEVHKHLM